MIKEWYNSREDCTRGGKILVVGAGGFLTALLTVDTWNQFIAVPLTVTSVIAVLDYTYYRINNERDTECGTE